jgi:DMSO/TMAO reductase YedYZ heme-binding membrane subunit
MLLHHSGSMTTTTIAKTSRDMAGPPSPVAVRNAPNRRAGDVASLVAGLGGGVTAAFTIPILAATNWALPGSLANALGIVTAMAGTYAALLSLLLMARLPWLEHEVGQDRLTAWHRTLGPWTLVLIVAHVVLTTLGYAQGLSVGWWSELVSLTFGTAWMVPAMVATLLMIGLGVMSWRRIRSRMKYETWHIAHLYFYLAVALAFGHQIGSGSVRRTSGRHRLVDRHTPPLGEHPGLPLRCAAAQSVRHDPRVGAWCRSTTTPACTCPGATLIASVLRVVSGSPGASAPTLVVAGAPARCTDRHWHASR